MKLTLAFQVYNKEESIESVVDSWISNLSGQNECEPDIWQVDSVCRPFCISRELLLSYGGMDEAFSPTCGDDLDLGIKLLKEGFTN